MPHIGGREHDQRDEDDAGERSELSGLRRKTAVYAAHDLIGLRRISDFFLSWLGYRIFKIERLWILSRCRHTQLLFPVLPE